MKTILKHIALFTLLFTADAFAQDVTTVRANNSDISDNLDLKAVASIFGDSSYLEDFERRLNDPELQISNLDLNGDGKVDYLRVVEATENNVHLIIIQSVLGPDTFQDVATIEVERDNSNNVQVQVVGDVYMYGANYVYEPVYVSRPLIYDAFWVSTYRPYYSPWYWGYYPTYYNYWAPYPVYNYRRRVHNHINVRNNYVYVNSPRSNPRAQALYNSRRQNAYERQHPNNGFSSRNKNVSNRYALEQTRSNNKANTRGAASGTRNSFSNSRNTNKESRSSGNANLNGTRVKSSDNKFSNSSSVRNVSSPARSTNNAVRTNTATRTEYTAPARTSNVQRSAPVQQQAAPVRVERSAPVQQAAPMRQTTPMQQAAPVRQSAPVQQAAPIRSAPAQMSAPARQSAPAQAAPARSTGGGSRRG
jgi:hypothetical protein